MTTYRMCRVGHFDFRTIALKWVVGQGIKLIGLLVVSTRDGYYDLSNIESETRGY